MPTSAFELLHPRVQQVVSDLGWANLHPAQEAAIQCFATDEFDLIVAAPTCAGKTEGVFLPILCRLVEKPAASVQVLCVSPLKALINDQHARLVRLCRTLDIAVHRWHGDVPLDDKRRLRERPGGILFITPESLESGFVNYPHRIFGLYRDLDYVVVDELHALLETERGAHVRSLLARLFAVIKRRPRCFALSATLADPVAARGFLNPDHPDSVRLLIDNSKPRPLQVEVVAVSGGAVTAATAPEPGDEETSSSRIATGLAHIAQDLRGFLRDGTSLVFTNSRRAAEELADYLREECELAVNGEAEAAVVLHHGSLSARVRRHTESLLKSGTPARAICTSSLELGIDIGAVEAVAQIDPTWTVSSMVQRLGRSGRRPGSTRQFRLYVRLASPEREASLTELLYPRLLQATAMVRLLLKGWLEPARGERMHLSTLVHQLLSILKETGGQPVLELYRSLCEVGPFRQVTPGDFSLLLQGLHANNLIQQDSEGILFLGLAGERVAFAPGFYAAFSTPVELTVRYGSKELGRLPATASLKEGQCLLLNGRRWTVDSITWKSRTIWVRPSTRKKAPVFLGNGGEIDDRISQEMRDVLVGDNEPEWLNADGRELLRSAREVARTTGLVDYDLLDLEEAVQWFPWVGTRTMLTLELWAQQQGLACTTDALSLTFEGVSRKELENRLTHLANDEPDAVNLAALMSNKQVERFDDYVDVALLDKANAKYRLNILRATDAARRAIAGPRLRPARWMPRR